MFEVQWEVKIYQFGLIFVHETTICNINRFVLQECADFTWRVSDCEELVGDKFLNRFMTDYFT